MVFLCATVLRRRDSFKILEAKKIVLEENQLLNIKTIALLRMGALGLVSTNYLKSLLDELGI